jgi:hypothetical protein
MRKEETEELSVVVGLTTAGIPATMESESEIMPFPIEDTSAYRKGYGHRNMPP